MAVHICHTNSIGGMFTVPCHTIGHYNLHTFQCVTIGMQCTLISSITYVWYVHIVVPHVDVRS